MSMLASQFDNDACRLTNKALQTQQTTQLYKALGLATAAAGAVGLIGTGAAVVPLAVGAGAWAIAALREKQNTGRFMPVPWSDSDGMAAMASAIGEGSPTGTMAITSYDHLSAADKAEYTLRAVLAPVLVPLLEGQTEDRQRLTLDQAKRTLIKNFPHIIDNPETIAPVLHGSLGGFQGAFALALPEDLHPAIAPAILAAATEARSIEDIYDAEVIEDSLTPPQPPAARMAPVNAPVVPLNSPAKPMGFDVAPVSPLPSAYGCITASPYRSRLFFGGQRTGKSFLAYNSAAAAASTGTEVYYINLASWGSEDDAYSAIACKSITANLQGMTAAQAEREIEAALRLLQAFFISDKPAILIFEEWCETGSRHHVHSAILEPLMTKAASTVEQLANTGQKRKKAIYATAPMFVAGNLAQTAKAAKSMELVLVAIAPGAAVDWNGQSITYSAPVFSQALANWHGLTEPTGNYGSDRIAFCDGAWRPVGNMPPVAPAKPKPDPREALEAAYRTTPALIDIEQVIIDLAADKGPITARVVKQYGGNVAKGYSTEEIREVFQELAAKGHGQCAGEGDRLSYSA